MVGHVWSEMRQGLAQASRQQLDHPDFDGGIQAHRSFKFNPYFVAILLVLVALAVYLKNFRVVSTIGIQDTEPQHLLAISLLTDGDFYLDEFVAPDGTLPMGTTRVGGHVVSNYPIVPALLNVPIYAVARSLKIDLYANRYLLSLFTAAIVAALSVGFMYLVLVEVSQRRTTALLGALIYAFGTGVWSTASQGLWQHGPSLLFITIALWLMLRNAPRYLVLSGLFWGLAVFNRPPNVLFALPMALYVVRYYRSHWKRFVVFAIVPLLAMAWYSSAVLGSVLTLGQTQDASLFSGDILIGLPGLLISPSRGLFVFTPVFVFGAAYCLYALFSSRAIPLLKYLTVSAIAMILLYAKWFSWWGGASFGYRLLLEIVPVLTIGLALCWENVVAGRRWLQAVFGVTVIVSFYTHYLGAFYYPCGFNSVPQNIDLQLGRLWSWTDGELARCTRSLVGMLSGGR
jgi:hypothetical protein